MRHFFFSFILLLVIASATLSTSSCSNDEGNIAEKTIVGKWKKIKQGSFPYTGYKTLLFQENGIVIFSSGEHTYQRTYAINNISIKDGKIYCIIMIDKDDETDLIGAPYECMLQDSIMTLNNLGYEHIWDATEYYIRIQ